MATAHIYVGDVLKRLGEIPDGTVRTCVTSPPYFGLRDYGTASWEGGKPECEHSINQIDADNKRDGQFEERVFRGDRSACIKCGATRVDSQIGLENTPDEYVANMVAVFREVKRVLADDGTLWLNIGDSYVGGKGQSGQGNPDKQAQRASEGVSINQAHHQIAGQGKTRPTDDRQAMREAGLKPKDLIGIPWRVAFALQADGWYLRSDIIWHKPNTMPESVTDRPTKAHEYVFLLSKSPRYYYDSEAIKEPAIYAGDDRGSRTDARRGTGMNSMSGVTGETKNKRDVWTINTKPFRGAHFAVMPEALVEPCVLAGSAEGDTVLDPFTGSGTVAVVAMRYGRNFVGTELNPEYAEIAYNRITNDAPMFNQVTLVE